MYAWTYLQFNVIEGPESMKFDIKSLISQNAKLQIHTFDMVSKKKGKIVPSDNTCMYVQFLFIIIFFHLKCVIFFKNHNLYNIFHLDQNH